MSVSSTDAPPDQVTHVLRTATRFSQVHSRFGAQSVQVVRDNRGVGWSILRCTTGHYTTIVTLTEAGDRILSVSAMFGPHWPTKPPSPPSWTGTRSSSTSTSSGGFERLADQLGYELIERAKP